MKKQRGTGPQRQGRVLSPKQWLMKWEEVVCQGCFLATCNAAGAVAWKVPSQRLASGLLQQSRETTCGLPMLLFYGSHQLTLDYVGPGYRELQLSALWRTHVSLFQNKASKCYKLFTSPIWLVARNEREASSMNKQRVKKMSLTKVEDTMALKWARTVNRGEEMRYIEKVKILQKAVSLSCYEVEREKAALLKFLQKVQMTSGQLNKDSPLSNAQMHTK